jgi:glycosyltransferase involved in cell wall biosynthesis
MNNLQQGTKLLSIVTISFNSLNDGLEQTLCSVIDSKNKSNEIEYIVIDGGSTDGSSELYERYNDQIDVMLSEKDKGISDAFNKGVMLASGKFIWFINSGDYLNENALEIILDSLKITSSDILFGDMYWVEPNKEALLLVAKSTYKEKIKYVMPFMHPSTIVSKQVFNKIGLFDLRLKRAMDYDLFLRAHLYGFIAEKIDVPFSFMVAGGTHDVAYHKTVREVMKISTFSGSGFIKAFSWMMYTYLCQKSPLFNIIKAKINKSL